MARRQHEIVNASDKNCLGNVQKLDQDDHIKQSNAANKRWTALQAKPNLGLELKRHAMFPRNANKGFAVQTSAHLLK